MAYQPIENYGLIGDMYTAALVGMDGSIDWLCLPYFDSPSVFAAILDDRKGGRFRIAPTIEGVTSRQLYWPDTNILITRFLCPDGVAEITDYMPVQKEGVQRSQQLIRRVNVVRGPMRFELECRPAFNYARDAHEVHISNEGACFYAPSMCLGLSSNVPLTCRDGAVVATFTLEAEASETFVLHLIEQGEGCSRPLSATEAEAGFKETVEFWHRWLGHCTYAGRWREMVHRSALMLKLLTFQPTGAIIAAPTCSLPETIGGIRNWDYRYTWLRDAAFTLYALLRIGFTEEAAAFMHWLEQRCREQEPDGSLQIMYRIDGRPELTEATLDHLEGYRGSSPVRIGNGASQQRQMDIYGEVIDAIYLYNKYGTPISYDLWTELRRMVKWVCDNWQCEDASIWETRGRYAHFVFSKLMCWVALDRALRMADARGFPADRARWLQCRDWIYEEIMEKGWDEAEQTFVQRYGSKTLDASNLIMPLVFFTAPSDPRMLKTVEATMRSPKAGGLVSNSLVYRYNVQEFDDGLEGEEGTFNMCTFWLVEGLTRAGWTDKAKLTKARLIFEKMLGYANHLGLYAEQTGHSGEALGNFPQAFTHLSLISAAYNLDRALGAHD